jgi:hypothetical protein
MVSRLNNDTARFLQSAPVLSRQSLDSFTEETQQARDTKPLIPILEQAKAVLGTRLCVLDEDTYLLDGKFCDLRTLVLAANVYIEKMGGRPLAYPCVSPLYEDSAPAMKFNYFLG